jgi:hypothetical protein
MSLEMLNSTGTTRSLRIEEVPKEEMNLAPDETLIPVAHFHKVAELMNKHCAFEWAQHDKVANNKDNCIEFMKSPFSLFPTYCLNG